MNKFEKFIKYILVAIGCVGICIIGIFAGYTKFRPLKTVEKPSTAENYVASINVSAPSDKKLNENNDKNSNKNSSEEQTEVDENKIQSTTKMIYEYFYPQDNITEKTEETAPYFLVNMDKEKLTEIFIEWEIVSFSSKEVVMRKTIEGESVQHYIVGIKDGYVAVFYKTPINGSDLKEITNTPIKSLTEEEQNMLEDGIHVVGEEQLLKVLEDYSS